MRFATVFRDEMPTGPTPPSQNSVSANIKVACVCRIYFGILCPLSNLWVLDKLRISHRKILDAGFEPPTFIVLVLLPAIGPSPVPGQPFGCEWQPLLPSKGAHCLAAGEAARMVALNAPRERRRHALKLEAPG